MIYLDYAASTPMDKNVLKAMEPYYLKKFANPSAINYSMGREARVVLNKARATVASVIGAKSPEIIFTAGGTEANNLAIRGVLDAFKGNIIISPLEHPSVSEPSRNYDFKVCSVDSTGLIDIQSLEKLIDAKTVLISVMLVNHEIGVIEPIKELSALVSKIKRKRLISGNNLPLYLHTDACQATNYLDLHVSKLGVDLMSVNGSKIYGPKQSGFLYVKSGTKLAPLIFGGGQERGLRSGTENLPGIVGLAKAMEITVKNRKKETKRVEQLREYFIDSLLNLRPDIRLNGSRLKRIANNVHITIPGSDNEWLIIKLDEAGIEAAAGSACSASSLEPSESLKAIGLNEESARQSLRFSLGRQTKKSDIDKCVLTLKKLIA